MRELQSGRARNAALSEDGVAADPGKSTLTDHVEHGDEGVPQWEEISPDEVAQHGVEGHGGMLPHLDQIQAAFGKHDVSGVKAHVGGAAASAARALGAQAYATGGKVAFGAAPDLHTAAHEAAHVVQQRGGVSYKGVDAPGDTHEAHADAVADAVVAGKSAEGLLDRRPSGIHPGVQRKKAEPYYAGTDQFNRKQQKGRPKVDDLVLTTPLDRFEIANGAAAAKKDTIPASANVTINVAHVRSLAIGGAKGVDCVLTRTVEGGAAWARLADLPGDHPAIKEAANKLASKYAPKSPKAHGTPHVFKSPGPTHSGYALTGHLGSQSKSNYDHYLERPGGLYNICLNLPQPGTPPVQVDVAHAGDHFFVIEKKEVALYKKGSSKQARLVHWAFGCVGKQDANGEWEPDKARRGWVPLADLEKA